MAQLARLGRTHRLRWRFVWVASAVVVVAVAALLARGAAPIPAATSSLVAAYAFDEGSGTTVTDASGNGNNGTVSNTSWASGKYGGALSFNGSSSRVNIPDAASLHLTTGMTLEAWVNPSSVTSSWRDVVYKGNDNYYLSATSTTGGGVPAGGGIIGGSYGEAYATAKLAAASWSFLALTYDGSTVRLYVNGTQVASTAKTGSLATSTNPLQIGSDTFYGQYFNGLIDNVRVYNVALAATDIQTDMTTPVVGDTSPPTAPGTLSANVVSSSRVDLSWGASSDNVGVTSYQIERCQGTGCASFGPLATVSGTTLSFSDTGLSPSTSYTYRVRAADAAGNLSGYSNTAAATTLADTTPPTTPGTLTANASSSSRIDLSWGASTDNVGVTNYLIERCQGSGCTTFAQVASVGGTTTSFSDTGLTASTSYSYRVRATDAAGNLSGYTNAASATTSAGADTSPPTTPGTLTVNAASSSRIDLSWGASTDNVGVTGYQIERCQGTGCATFGPLATVSGTTLTYSDTGLSPSTSYTYRVRATDAAGNLSGYTNTASATTAADTTPPTAPGTLTANPFSSSRVDLSWGAATDNVAVAGYQIERCQGSGCSSFVQIATVGSLTLAYSDTTVSGGTTYGYRVRATDSAGNAGPYSNTAAATPPTAPTGLVAAYSFDAGSGTTVADSSGNGNTGTITNATWAAGKYGSALSFNGSSSRVNIPDAASLHLTTGMTLEAWVNPTTVTSAWRDLIYKGDDNYYLSATSTNGGGVPAGGGIIGGGYAEAYGTAKLATATWTHLALTYDGSAVRLYVNGTQVASTAKTGSIKTSTNALQIGSDSIYGQYFNGLVDEVRVYNVALSAAQIQTDMATPIGGGATDTTPPTAPGTLTANASSSTRVDLAWGASTDNVGVTGYLVERCQGTGCSGFTQIASVSGTTLSYSDTTAVPTTTYSYRVRATDAAGNLGAYGNTATTTTPSGGDTIPPSAPGTLTATPSSSSRVDLAWGAATDNVGVTGYQIERCQGTGCATFGPLATVSGTTLTYSDTGTSPGTIYNYRVRATDAAGNLGAYGNTATATTPADTTPPSAPSSLTATAVSSGRVDLGWTAASDNVGVTGYLVERCQGASCTAFTQIATLGGTATAYSDTAVAASTSYSYRVRATDAAGNLGPYSGTATATTPAATAPAGLVAAYSFDEGTGSTVADASNNGNNGTITNATWVTGKYGTALSFNGTTSRVSVLDAASLHLTTAMTLEAWVDPSTVSSAWRDVIYKGDDNYYLSGTSAAGGVPAGGGVIGGSYGEAYGTSALPLATWTHLALTYDGTAVRLYVNGTQVSSTAKSGSLATSSNPLQIGSDSIYGQYFSGLIDEVRVYNAALSAAQIQTDMATPIQSVPTAPTNLSASPVGTGEVDLSWTAATDAIGVTTYQIERCSPSGCGNFAQVAAVPGTTTTYKDTSVAARTSYSYRVRAGNSGGTFGGYSNVATAFTGLTVTPRVTEVTFTGTQQFIANNVSGGVTWSVDGVAGGNSSTGTIDSSGIYTPPQTTGTHTVTATTLDSSQTANASIYVTNYPGVFTYHDDNQRTGQNLGESVLTPSNVNASSFGKLFTYNVDGIVYTQPLYVANVNIPGQGFHNVVYVATEHDSVYAFDADGRTTAPLWQRSFINPSAGVTTIPAADTGDGHDGDVDIGPETGITGTPVIDPTTNTMYLVAATKEVSGGTTTYVQRLHALDLTTGAEKFGGPVAIQASVPGTGDGASGGQLAFNALRENQRTALTLVNGNVYFGFASHADFAPFHGWVFGYNATTLQRTLAYCASPNGSGGGVWQSGDGLATDASGNLFFTTGNGTFDVNSGGADYGDSIEKLTPSGSVADYFTPHDQATLDSADLDLASGGVLLLPDQSGTHPHELIAAGKSGTLYVVDRDNMGHFNASNDNQIVESLPNIFPNGGNLGLSRPGNYSAPVYYNGTVFMSPVADNIMTFPVTNGLLARSPAQRSAATFDEPGGPLSISANGSTNGILWAIQVNGVNPGGLSTNPGVLYAYDAGALSGSTLTELYNSNQAGTRDALDLAAKFTPPTAANGRVYVASMSQLTVYGLLP